MRAWLGSGVIRYDVWGEDTALVSADDGVLRIVCPTVFRRKLAGQLHGDERVRRAMAVCFPGCNRLELVDRDDDRDQQTHREVQAEEARLRQEALVAAVEAHEDVLAVREALGAVIVGISGRPDAALPPPLDPEEQ
jgi:hypothetical protein